MTRPNFVSPQRTASAAADPLSSYFRDLSHFSVLGRDQEFEAAVAIFELRCRHWRALLSYLPFCAEICSFVRELMPAADRPEADLMAMVKATKDLRRRELAVHQRAYDDAVAALATTMADADRDGIVSERLLADITSYEAGEGGLGLKVKQPRRDSTPFMTYVATVRASHQALWSAKHKFVRANLRLVVTVARRFNHGRLPLHDLIQEGNIGLMKAVDRFDHRRGFRFSTYASWWIRHAISRALADTGRAVRLPVHMSDACAKVNKVRREFEALYGREPTDAEVAGLSEVSLERIQRMRWSLTESPISLDQPIGQEPGRTLLDNLEDPTDLPVSELLDSELLHNSLREALSLLSPIEAAVLRNRMGLDDEPEQTLKEIGERHALSRERIRQIQEQALGRLRREFKRRDLM